MRFQFNSDRLSLVLEKVRNQHPLMRSEFISIGESIIDEVRRLLEQTDFDHLKKLSFQFDLPKLLACIEIVAIDREGNTAEKAAKIAAFRPRDSMVVKCWFKLISFYPVPLLEQLLKDLVGIRGFSSLENHKRISNHVPRWFLASKLSHGIFRDYQSTSDSDTLDRFLTKNFLTAEDALFNVVWFTLLTGGKKNDLKRQYPMRILAEMKNCQRSSDLMMVGQHYLNTLNGLTDWYDDVLEYIRIKFGKPNSALDEKKFEHRFWHPVKESAKEQFRRWLIIEEIESFFEGERAEFWRSYVNSAKVQDVNKILAGEGFMLNFGHFGVIEFKNVGHAAYIYPIDVFNKFWKSANFWIASPSFFKEGTKTVRSNKFPTWDGRIIHYTGWQSTAKERIDILMDDK
jgi:hypothetical protein